MTMNFSEKLQCLHNVELSKSKKRNYLKKFCFFEFTKIDRIMNVNKTIRINKYKSAVQKIDNEDLHEIVYIREFFNAPKIYLPENKEEEDESDDYNEKVIDAKSYIAELRELQNQNRPNAPKRK